LQARLFIFFARDCAGIVVPFGGKDAPPIHPARQDDRT
jgi:hypothetical protein